MPRGFVKHGPCERCGSWENLEADHRDRSTKAMNPRALWSMAESNPRRVEELKRLVARCFDYHLAKTKADLTKPLVHGTINGYKAKGCRC